jgi:NAD(P)H-nitrite reductase large subunit
MGTQDTSNEVVCQCLGITEAQVVAAIRADGLSTIKQVTACTDAGGGCRSCHPALGEYLARENKLRALRTAGIPAPSPVGSPAYASR